MKNLLKSSFLALLLTLMAGQVLAQYSTTSDGKDFFVGFMYPSYNKVGNASTDGFYGAYALVSSYTDNHIQVSYYDRQTGVETPAGRYLILARTGIQIPLNLQAMRPQDSGEVAEFCACHITAERPISVEFFSTGACSGGSFLPLPTSGLGKKYVVASYFDNPGNGGLLGGYLGPSELEISHGFFEIVAPFDSTKVTITPNALTHGGRIGTSFGPGATGVPRPFVVTLRRGQCYLVKSGSGDMNIDISGSIVESNKPVAVLAGHENAFIGGVSGKSLEGRDFMVEQMVPADQWDSAGYVSIPLQDSQPADPALYDGVGENYRVFTDDSNTVGVRAQVDGASQYVSLSTIAYWSPAREIQNVVTPMEFHSTDGRKFSVMMYDQRNFATTAPYPAPSMMTIIPMSHWRTSFLWYVPTNKFESLQAYYVNILAPTADFDNGTGGLGGIKASFNGGTIKPIKAVISIVKQYKNIPNTPGIAGITFKLSPGSYFATGPHPFMVYNFGFRALDPNFDLGDFDGDDFFFSYALPVGMSFGGGQSHFRITIDSQCTSWNICVHDSTFGIPGYGIKSISLLDDPTQVLIKTSPKSAKAYYNSRLDDSLDPGYPGGNTNEINLADNDTNICFKVLVNKPTDSAYAPVFIVDEHGNGYIIDLYYKPPYVKLTSDSVRYLKVPIGKDTCQSFVFSNVGQVIISNDTIVTYNIFTHKNDTTINLNAVHHLGRSYHFTSDKLKRGNSTFQVTSTVPSLPTDLQPGDSLVVTACFTPRDSITQRDTILLVNDCFTSSINLMGKGAVPLIVVGNRDFGNVIVDSTKCDTVSIRNVGDAEFTLTANWLLSNTSNFSFADKSLLPIVIKPGQVVYLELCYTPHTQTLDSGVMHWGTNLADPYKHTIKDTSILRGRGVKSGFVWDRNFQEIAIDTTSGIDSSVVRVHLFNNAVAGSGSPTAHVDSVILTGVDAPEFALGNNQLGYKPLGNFDLKPGDSIWVDVIFKPDMTKPTSQIRHTQLVAMNRNLEKDQIIELTGVIAGKSSVSELEKPTLFTVSPNPASGGSVIVSLNQPQESKGLLAVFDILGREVYHKDIMQGISMAEIPLRNMHVGVYYVRFTSDLGTLTQKFEVVK